MRSRLDQTLVSPVFCPLGFHVCLEFFANLFQIDARRSDRLADELIELGLFLFRFHVEYHSLIRELHDFPVHGVIRKLEEIFAEAGDSGGHNFMINRVYVDVNRKCTCPAGGRLIP